MKCLWFCRKKKPVFTPTPEERLREFFIFCDALEQHPFFVAHRGGTTFNIKADFPETGEDTVVLNFDEVHLESFLTRLRQFLFQGELFYLKDLRRSINEVVGEDQMFREFYDKLWQSIRRPFPQADIQAFKSNGADIVAGFSFPELLQARLYTGAIHSEKKIDPNAAPALTGVGSAHIAVSKHLTFVLAGASMKAAQNVFAVRCHILRLARIAGKTGLFPELEAFHKRSTDAGH